MRGLHSMRPSHSEGKPAKDACAMLRPISAKAASSSAVPVHTGVTGVAAQLSSKASLAPQQHLHLLCQAGVRRKRRDCSMHPITTSHHSLLLRCLGIAGQLAQCKHETDQTKPSHANQLPSSMPTSHVLEKSIDTPTGGKPQQSQRLLHHPPSQPCVVEAHCKPCDSPCL